jgi:hypothetical protein
MSESAIFGFGEKLATEIDAAGRHALVTKSIVGSVNGKLREAFEAYPNPNWTTVQKAAADLVMVDGNAAGASYLVVSLDPLTAGTSTSLETVDSFHMPFDLVAGLHTSQRTLGQELAMEAVSVEPPAAAPADLTIASISQTTTVLSAQTTIDHGLRVGDRIGIAGVIDSRLNYPALVVATTLTPNTFTATAGPGGTIPSVTAGPFTSGVVYARTAMGFSPNGTSLLLENATATNGSVYAKAEGGDPTPVGGTIAGSHAITLSSSASVQAINAALNYAFRPTTEFRLSLLGDRLQWSDVVVDSVAQSTNRALSTQTVPNPDVAFKIRFRAVNAKAMTVPVAQIVSAVKTGTTAATLNTDVPHGLTVNDVINVYGIRDQAAFPNLTVATAIASVPTANSFTVAVFGTAASVTSFGGFVSRVNGGVTQPGAIAQAVQSIGRSANLVSAVGSAAWSGLLIGDYVNLVGVRDNVTGVSLGVDGSYRVRDLATVTLSLEPIGSAPTGGDIALTNCGGGVIKRTDLRISHVRLTNSERLRVEALARPATDAAAAFPVAVQNSPSVTIGSGTVTTVGAVTNAGTPAAPTNYFLSTAASTNGALIITATLGVNAFYAFNGGGADAFVKLYNKATAPVVGTDVPEMTIRVPAGNQIELAPGFNGYRFPLGLGIAVTGGAAVADTTPVALNQVQVKMSRVA